MCPFAQEDLPSDGLPPPLFPPCSSVAMFAAMSVCPQDWAPDFFYLSCVWLAGTVRAQCGLMEPGSKSGVQKPPPPERLPGAPEKAASLPRSSAGPANEDTLPSHSSLLFIDSISAYLVI